VAEDTHISRGFHNNAPVREGFFYCNFISVKRRIQNARIAASSSYAYTSACGVRTAQDGATHAQILNKLLPSHGVTLSKKHHFQVGRQHRVIWRKGGSARSEVQYLPQVISRMRWRRNKPADKETRSTNKLRLWGRGQRFICEGSFVWGLDAIRGKVRGETGRACWYNYVTRMMFTGCKKSPSSARGYRLTSKHASYIFPINSSYFSFTCL
jgi:hypothetical protein